MLLKVCAYLAQEVREMDNLPLALTVKDVAKLLGISRNTTYRLVRSKKLPSIRVGRQIRIPRSALEEYLNGRTDCNQSA